MSFMGVPWISAQLNSGRDRINRVVATIETMTPAARLSILMITAGVAIGLLWGVTGLINLIRFHQAESAFSQSFFRCGMLLMLLGAALRRSSSQQTPIDGGSPSRTVGQRCDSR